MTIRTMANGFRLFSLQHDTVNLLQKKMRYTIAPENCTRSKSRSNILLYDETDSNGRKQFHENDMKISQ